MQGPRPYIGGFTMYPYVLAHSMGNQILTRALEILHKRGSKLTLREGRFAFAAPDVAAGDFVARVKSASKLGYCCLYAASNDWPLLLSGLLRAMRQRRAGVAGAFHIAPLVGRTFETVDCTYRRENDPSGHSYSTKVCLR